MVSATDSKRTSIWTSRLFRRLFLINTIAAGVFLLFAGLYLELELSRSVLRDTTRDLEVRARLVLDDLTRHGGTVNLQEFVTRTSGSSGARITIIGRDGIVKADSEMDAARMGNIGARPEVAAAIKEGTGSDGRSGGTRDEQYLFVAVTDLARPDGDIVRVALPDRLINNSLSALRTTLLVTVLALFVAGIGLSFALTRVIVQPIEQVRQAAQAVAAGNLDRPIEISRRDEFGKLVGAFNTMVRELSARLSQLEANRRELSAIMNNMGEGLLLVDSEGKVLLANHAAEQMLGTAHNDLAGHALWERVRLPEIDELLASLPNLTEPRRIWVEDRTAGSQRRVLAFVATPLFESQGGARHAVLLISDATEDQKLLEMRQDFVANVSHELKTPLTSISAYVETLLDGADSDEAVRRPFLEKIQTNATRLTKLVSDILNISRLESGIGDESRQHIDLNEVAQNCIRKHAEAAAAKKLQVTLHASAEPAMALVNEEDMTEAVDNLLVNAISYTPAEGRIDITVQQNELGLVLEVKDTGMGIPKDALPRVFERFYRVDKARSRALGGTGLGLAIVKHVALKHGGKVEAESEVGKGSTFRISLPAAPIAKR